MEVVRWTSQSRILEEAGDPSGETSKEEYKQGAADSEHHQLCHLSLRRRARRRPAGIRLRHGQARVLGTVQLSFLHCKHFCNMGQLW